MSVPIAQTRKRLKPPRVNRVFTAEEDGLVPAPDTVTGTRALFDDGTWQTPSGGSSIPDGDKGDITVTGSGTIWSIDADSVTNSKLANVPTATFKGRTTAGTGDPEDLTVAQAKSLLSLTGTNSGDQTITLTGDVTGSGTSSFAATIAADAVTFPKLQNIATNKLLGRSTAGVGDIETIDVGTGLSLVAGTLSASGGSGVSDGDYGDIVVSGSGTVWTIDSSYTASLLSSSATSVQDGHFGDVYLKDDTSPSHYLKITDAEDLTGARTLSLSVADGNRSLTLQANLTVSGAADVSGTNTGDQTITLTGDVTGTGTSSFAATIGNDKVTFPKMQNIATDSLIGRDTAGTGDPENILLNATLSMDGAGNLQRAALTGDVTASAGSNATTIANDAVTFAKFQNITDARLLGRSAGSSGDMQEITVGTGLSLAAGALTSTITQYTDEQAQDAVGAMVDASLTYVDATPLLQRAALTGDVTASAGSNTTTIPNDTVTYAKMQNMTTQRILGRTTAGAGDVEELTATSPITLVAASGTVGFDQTATLGNNARVAVAKAGSVTGTRREINFIEGSGMSITLADDSGGEKVDITLASSGVTSTSHQQIMARIAIGV